MPSNKSIVKSDLVFRQNMDAAEEVIKTKIANNKHYHIGQNEYNWTNAQIMARNRWIVNKIVKEGMSAWTIRKYMAENWDISDSMAKTYLDGAMDALVELKESTKERAMALHRERLEDLYNRAVKENKIDSALKVLEQMAKINGYYNDTMIVAAPVLQFKFGDDDNTIYLKQNGTDTNGLQTPVVSEGGA